MTLTWKPGHIVSTSMLWEVLTIIPNKCRQLQNRSFHVVERTRTSSKCQKMKNARAKRAKILFFIVKYANLWVSCCCGRRGCLSSLILQSNGRYFKRVRVEMEAN